MAPSTGSSADDQNPALQMIKITGVDAKKKEPRAFLPEGS